MSASAKSTDGRTFQIRNVQTVADIPVEIWRQALPDIKKAFPCVMDIGEVPTLGGSISINVPPARQKWNPYFCTILSQFDGTPLTATAA